jgi:hypothetical protein
LSVQRILTNIIVMANKDMEIVFDVVQEQDGGFVADCLNEDIVTEGDSWEELRNNVREAVSAFFFDSTPPAKIRLHMVRDEVLTVA